MIFPKFSKSLMQRATMASMAIVSAGLVANSVTFTRLNAMPLEERWCVKTPAPAETPAYLNGGYKPIPDAKRAWFYLPEGAVRHDRNRLLWDAGCPRMS